MIMTMMLTLSLVMKICREMIFNHNYYDYCMKLRLRAGNPIECIGDTISGPTQFS